MKMNNVDWHIKRKKENNNTIEKVRIRERNICSTYNIYATFLFFNNYGKIFLAEE